MERSFHAFYALTASGKHGMKPASHYAYLRQSGCYESQHVRDLDYFGDVNAAFTAMGFSSSAIERIWGLVGCVLKLGNVEFDDSLRASDESRPCRIVGK